MAFTLTEQQLERMAEVRVLARDVLAPLVAAGQPGRVNRGLVRALGRHGLIAELVPPERGGPAPSALGLCLLRESLAREIDVAERDLFDFAGARCDRIVAAVNTRLDE